MARDDSALYTGQTSVSLSSPAQRILNEKRSEAAAERKKLRQQIDPTASLFMAELQREIDDVQKVDYLKLDDGHEQFYIDAMSNKKTLDRLCAVKQRIELTLHSHD